MSRSDDQTQHLSILQSGHLPSDQAPSHTQLQSFPNRWTKTPYLITIDFPEFTSLCPVTGQPDFGRIYVEYIPHALCVETKSWKLYMQSYRNHHTFMETVTNQILSDLCLVLDPAWCRVQGLFAPRGGTRLNVYAERFATTLSSEQTTQIRDFVAQYRIDAHIQTVHQSVNA